MVSCKMCRKDFEDDQLLSIHTLTLRMAAHEAFEEVRRRGLVEWFDRLEWDTHSRETMCLSCYNTLDSISRAAWKRQYGGRYPDDKWWQFWKRWL